MASYRTNIKCMMKAILIGVLNPDRSPNCIRRIIIIYVWRGKFLICLKIFLDVSRIKNISNFRWCFTLHSNNILFLLQFTFITIERSEKSSYTSIQQQFPNSCHNLDLFMKNTVKKLLAEFHENSNIMIPRVSIYLHHIYIYIM